MAVRQTEADFIEKLFDVTALILQAVESFMNVEFPEEVLHSVALPNFSNDFNAFYGFNYYRFVFLSKSLNDFKSISISFQRRFNFV